LAPASRCDPGEARKRQRSLRSLAEDKNERRAEGRVPCRSDQLRVTLTSTWGRVQKKTEGATIFISGKHGVPLRRLPAGISRAPFSGALETAFQRLLDETGRHCHWQLIPKQSLKVGKTHIAPDGTFRDLYNTRCGFWEFKDTGDDLDKDGSPQIEC
jgi:hypothetical protein